LPARCCRRGRSWPERAELRDERLGGLVADSGHTGDVVRGVANERLVVRHALRREAVALEDGGGVVLADIAKAPNARQHDLDVVPNQLQQVGVAGDDDHFVALVSEAAGERANDIVGLISLALLDGDVERVDQLANARDLRPKVLRHLAAGAFVLRVEFVAERMPAFQSDDGVVGLPLPQDVEQHRREAEHRVRLLTTGGGERRRQGVIGAEDQAVPVDENDGSRLRRCF
jgi:hypothetical protein